MVPSAWTAVRPSTSRWRRGVRGGSGGTGAVPPTRSTPAGRSMRSRPPASRLVASFQARVPGASVITEAPGTRAWKDATSRLAGGRDLMDLPAGVDLVGGTAPVPPLPPRTPLRHLDVEGLTAVHADGTIGVADVTFSVLPGQLVLLLGSV